MAVRRPAAAGRIVRNPRVLGGEPIVCGTRIPVRSIVLAALLGAEHVMESTQNRALPALLFLYSEVLGRDLAWLVNSEGMKHARLCT